MKKLLKTLKFSSQYKGIAPVLMPTGTDVIESYACPCQCSCQRANDDMQSDFHDNQSTNESSGNS